MRNCVKLGPAASLCAIGLHLFGCADLHPSPGRLECEGHSDCPSGWYCALDLRCYPPGADAGPIPCDVEGVDATDCNDECECESDTSPEHATETHTEDGASDSETQGETESGNGTASDDDWDTAPDGGRDTMDTETWEDAGFAETPTGSGTDGSSGN